MRTLGLLVLVGATVLPMSDAAAAPALTDVELHSLAGDRVTVSPDRPTLLWMWIAPCDDPCTELTQGLAEIRAAYPEEELAIYGVAITETVEAVAAWADAHPLPVPVVTARGHRAAEGEDPHFDALKSFVSRPRGYDERPLPNAAVFGRDGTHLQTHVVGRSRQAAELRVFLDIAVGRPPPVPPLRVYEADGRSYLVSDFEGRVTLFWTWNKVCTGCISALEHELAALQQAHPASLSVVAVNRPFDEEDREDQRRWAAEHLPQYPQLYGDDLDASGGPGALWGAGQVPVGLIVGRDGELVGYHMGYGGHQLAQLEELMNHVLARDAQSE